MRISIQEFPHGEDQESGQGSTGQQVALPWPALVVLAVAWNFGAQGR
jgi:hypothetical protein